MERTMGASAKTRFLYKSETDVSNRMLIQWVNYVSRECVNALPRLLPDTAGEDNFFDFSLPKHEQVYEVAELRSGKTLSRVVFFLIYSMPPFEKENTGNRFETSEESKLSLGEKTNFQCEKKEEREMLFTKDHLLALKDAENNPEVLLELTVKYASDFLYVPLYNFQDILEGTKKETFTFMGNLFLSSSPISVGNQEQNTQILLTENNEVQRVLQKSQLKAEQGSKWLLEVEEALKEYHMPSKMIHPVVARIQGTLLEQGMTHYLERLINYNEKLQTIK
jgi:truncated hemoglobin YjbI